MVSRAGLRRSERLTAASDYPRVFRRGVRLDGRLFLLVAAESARRFARLGLAASRKVGDAVRRNRARRLLRESFRRHKPAFGVDLVFVVKRELPDAGLEEVEALVVEQHHAYARRALPYLVALLGKVTARHRARNPKLASLSDAGEALADTLEASLDVEERELFAALAAGAPAGEGVRRELDEMYRRHRELRLLLVRIRWLADDFAVPAWADRSYQVLMEELEALEANLLEHVHLERVLLGPRLSSLCVRAC